DPHDSPKSARSEDWAGRIAIEQLVDFQRRQIASGCHKSTRRIEQRVAQHELSFRLRLTIQVTQHYRGWRVCHFGESYGGGVRDFDLRGRQGQAEWSDGIGDPSLAEKVDNLQVCSALRDWRQRLDERFVYGLAGNMRQ